jgi:hypothetical protein
MREMRRKWWFWGLDKKVGERRAAGGRQRAASGGRTRGRGESRFFVAALFRMTNLRRSKGIFSPRYLRGEEGKQVLRRFAP